MQCLRWASISNLTVPPSGPWISCFSRSMESVALEPRSASSNNFSRSSGDTRIGDRKSTRLNSSHTEIYTLSLHDALPIWTVDFLFFQIDGERGVGAALGVVEQFFQILRRHADRRSEEHTSELQSHRDLHSFPTRRSSDLDRGFPVFPDRWRAWRWSRARRRRTIFPDPQATRGS